jgi:hypothetical protein
MEMMALAVETKGDRNPGEGTSNKGIAVRRKNPCHRSEESNSAGQHNKSSPRSAARARSRSAKRHPHRGTPHLFEETPIRVTSSGRVHQLTRSE